MWENAYVFPFPSTLFDIFNIFLMPSGGRGQKAAGAFRARRLDFYSYKFR